MNPVIVENNVSWGFRPEKSPRLIDTIVLHSLWSPDSPDGYALSEVIKILGKYDVSPHYLICRKGLIHKLVDDLHVAYHAGKSEMPDKRINVNEFSIGIEIINAPHDKPTGEQFVSLTYLCKTLTDNYSINFILGHNEIATGRKTDPWNFDWESFRREFKNEFPNLQIGLKC